MATASAQKKTAKRGRTVFDDDDDADDGVTETTAPASKRGGAGTVDDFDTSVDAGRPVTDAAFKPYPETKSTRAKPSTISPLQLLPRLSELKWVAVVSRADSLLDMASYLKPLNPVITLYPTDHRKLVKEADEDGPAVYTGFRGIAIDAMDASVVCMTVARLAEQVCLNPKTGDLDALPEAYEPREVSVMVNTDLLVSLLSDIPSSDTVALYVTEAAQHLLFVVNCDSEGQLLTQNLAILGGAPAHDSIKGMKFRYEMLLPLARIKNTVKRACKIKADALVLSMYERPDGSLVLTMEADGEGASVFQPVQVAFVKDIDGDSKSSEGSADAAGATHSMETYARLKGTLPQLHPADASAPILQTNIEQLRRVYRGNYSVKFLKSMLAPIGQQSMLNLFLSSYDEKNPENRWPNGTPLLMRFDLHKYESFVTYVLASMMDHEGA